MSRSGSGIRIGPSPIHGCGVFAAADIDPGSFIGTFVGQVTSTDGTHVLWVHDGDAWQAIEGTGPLRFLNHSSSPNARFDERDLYATTGIEAGTEITIDYGPDWADVDQSTQSHS